MPSLAAYVPALSFSIGVPIFPPLWLRAITSHEYDLKTRPPERFSRWPHLVPGANRASWR